MKSDKDYQSLIHEGEFTKAKQVIENLLENDLPSTPLQELKLQFELERMDRIRKDFTQTEEELLAYIREVIPDITGTQVRHWETTRALEFINIDGEKHYFNYAGRNLFRIDKEALGIWKAKHVDEPMTAGSCASLDLDRHNKDVIEASTQTGKRYVEPIRLRVRQSVKVQEGVVPEGEIIRCWIPFPRDIPGRQGNIRVSGTEPGSYLIADNDVHLQRTIYLEKAAQAGVPTHFQVEYEYTSRGSYVGIDPSSVIPVESTPALEPFVAEEPPHVVFTPALHQLSKEIVGEETNPYLVARRLFEWVDTNIPWASAREYSTIRNISSYAYENMHGDCGIQTLLFMTLCRMNGIPTRWQSGWEFQPPDDSMHDWGMIYFEPYGWVPMDVTYGLREAEDERLKWFYLHGMDSYRLVFNDAYSWPFYPAKIHPRSETVDSQRGEVEWRGGNLYFDQWSWGFEWEVIE